METQEDGWNFDYRLLVCSSWQRVSSVDENKLWVASNHIHSRWM
jgi:hypothetical protein